MLCYQKCSYSSSAKTYLHKNSEETEMLLQQKLWKKYNKIMNFATHNTNDSEEKMIQNKVLIISGNQALKLKWWGAGAVHIKII
jgi:hypothetical protein